MGAPPFRVLIIGGGNCGLALATGLQQTRDWGMLIHWGTEYIEKLLPPDLQARIREPRVDPDYDAFEPLPHVNGKTGEIIGTVDSKVMTRVSRKKLRRFLTEGRGLDIQFNKYLTSLTTTDAAANDGITAHFSDGTSESASLVIGCDGSRSKVREFIVGCDAAQLHDSGITIVNYAASHYTAEQARLLRTLHPIVKLASHPDVGGSALLAALDIPSPTSDPTAWRFQIYTSWAGPPSASTLADPVDRMRFIRARMAHFCDPFRTAFLGVDEDEVMPVYTGNQWAPPLPMTTAEEEAAAGIWENHGGRVTIAGDAAHAMLPHRGQGLNNALKDASDLVDAIRAVAVEEKQTLGDAIGAYEAEMRPRGANEVRRSYELAQKSAQASSGGAVLLRAGMERRPNT